MSETKRGVWPMVILGFAIFVATCIVAWMITRTKAPELPTIVPVVPAPEPDKKKRGRPPKVAETPIVPSVVPAPKPPDPPAPPPTN